MFRDASPRAASRRYSTALLSFLSDAPAQTFPRPAAPPPALPPTRGSPSVQVQKQEPSRWQRIPIMCSFSAERRVSPNRQNLESRASRSTYPVERRRREPGSPYSQPRSLVWRLRRRACAGRLAGRAAYAAPTFRRPRCSTHRALAPLSGHTGRLASSQEVRPRGTCSGTSPPRR